MCLQNDLLLTGQALGILARGPQRVIGVHTGTVAARPPSPRPASCHPTEGGGCSTFIPGRHQGVGCPQTCTRMPGSHGVTDKDPALISRAGQTPTLACLALLESVGPGNSHTAPSEGLPLLLNLLFRQMEPHHPLAGGTCLACSGWPLAPHTGWDPLARPGQADQRRVCTSQAVRIHRL